MRKFNNVLLIRIGSTNIERIKHPVHCPPPLSLKYAQALLERHGSYNVKLVDGWVTPYSFDDLLKIIFTRPVDLVVISIATYTSEAGIHLSRLIKRHADVFIIGVGQDVTARYQDYLALGSVFDVIIRGEFEQELLSLIERLNNTNNIEAIKEYYRFQKSGKVIVVPHLDDLPSLNWKREELKQYPFIYPLRLNKRVLCGYISSSRGCPYNCIFCSSAVRKSNGKEPRLRSASKIVDEIEDMQKLGVNVVSFEDDNFTTSREHVFSICHEIQKRSLDVKWATHVRIDEVTPASLKTMKNSGCILLLFGIESGSRRIINILAKNPREIDWVEKAKNIFHEAKEIGIATCALFIVGSPTETEREVEESIKLAHDLKPDMIKVHFFTLYPGSTAYNKFRDRVNPTQVSSQHHYLQPLVNVSDMETAKLKNIQIKFYRRFLFKFRFIVSHFSRYIFFYLFNWSMSCRLVKKALFFLFFKR